ncbi:unnamed protein product [Clavelina lepadiformis]|uniref:FCS-type domain-containing protein n=1 Tax=Clavelina lepadiformis TaxID=159417 RepID=A0ABP0GZU0_CLALP
MESPTKKAANVSDKEETATCEFCGKVGSKKSFYSTTKRFCGPSCSHSYSARHRKYFRERETSSSPNLHTESPIKSGTKKRKLSYYSGELTSPLVLPSEMERREISSSGFDWGKYLIDHGCQACPVHLFPHAQMALHWAEIDDGVKVEVLNLDCPVPTKVYWIAQVTRVAGYKALLRYEGFGDEEKYDFWCNLCTHDVHAVGWCATMGKPLVPPKTIQFKYSNWKNFLVQRLTGSKTLPNDFQQRVAQSLDCPFLVNMRLEVMDKTQISRMRIGIVEEVVGGRLKLRYEDSDEANDDFWCHAGSPVIHNVGWSEKVGHRILVASKDYKNVPGYKNCKPEYFTSVKQVKTCGFKVGMKLEAIDPLNLSCICIATVKKVLKNGYVMIGIDGSEAADGTDWFCYHCSSPSIFPVGFCDTNDINLALPKDCKEPFSWEEYLKETGSEAAPVNLFNREKIPHGFVPGMKLEAVDLMEPRLICVATVARVVGRLLRIHFDGWENDYDQWVDSQSPDIYPVGWCELVGYDLQPPANLKAIPSSDGLALKKKPKLKGQTFTGKKKRKRFSVTGKKPAFQSENQSNVQTTKNGDMEMKVAEPDFGTDNASSNDDTNNSSVDKSLQENAEEVIKQEDSMQVDPAPPELTDLTEACPSLESLDDSLVEMKEAKEQTEASNESDADLTVT